MTATAIVAALGIGLLLGLLGGGGSILLVPVFMHVLGMDAKLAVAVSLPVVGLTSLGGSVVHWRAGHVDPGAAVRVGAIAMAAAYAGARIGVLLPAVVQVVLLGVVMVAAGWSMLRSTGAPAAEAPATRATRSLQVGAPLGIGLLTGVTGVGGGFLFVPALVLLEQMPFATAVGTSLLVIAANAGAGLAGYVGHVVLPWRLILAFAATASLGAITGARMAARVSPLRLRRAFGALLLAVAGAVLLRTLVS